MPARQNILILDDYKFFSSLARRLAANSGNILEECNDPGEINAGVGRAWPIPHQALSWLNAGETSIAKPPCE